MAKNPLMSLWFSAANAWAGGARNFWTSQARRQQSAMLDAVMKPGTAKPVRTDERKGSLPKAAKPKSGPKSGRKSATRSGSKSGRRTSGR